MIKNQMKKSENIPKIIHYCWFGKGELPEFAIKCIESWKKYMPEYEIKEWNEDNFDIHYNKYVEQAYEKKKYAFVSDVARLYAIYNEGGIYLDTDVEVIKSFNPLLKYDAFFGFESPEYVATGLGFGAKKNNKIVKAMLNDYKNLSFINEDNEIISPACPVINTKVLISYGLKLNGENQILDNNVGIFSEEFFCPKNYYTEELKITKNTYSIHHYKATWHSKKEEKLVIKRRNFLKKYGNKVGNEKYEKYLKTKKKINYLTYPFKAILYPKKAINRIKGWFKK